MFRPTYSVFLRPESLLQDPHILSIDSCSLSISILANCSSSRFLFVYIGPIISSCLSKRTNTSATHGKMVSSVRHSSTILSSYRPADHPSQRQQSCFLYRWRRYDLLCPSPGPGPPWRKRLHHRPQRREDPDNGKRHCYSSEKCKSNWYWQRGCKEDRESGKSCREMCKGARWD